LRQRDSLIQQAHATAAVEHGEHDIPGMIA
jgi:hypothetical protein